MIGVGSQPPDFALRKQIAGLRTVLPDKVNDTGSRVVGRRPHRLSLANIVAPLLVATLGACSAQRPVLYPNAHYQVMGKTAAQLDIDDCMQLARKSGVNTGTSKKVARQTAESAAVGAAAAGAYGAVRGRSDTAERVAAGAAGAGAAGLARASFRANEPGSLFRNFVNRCLSEKGYAPIGWQ
jgi:hypothetical protein